MDAAAADAGGTLRVQSTNDNTFLCKMTSWPPSWRRVEKPTPSLMRIYLKNTPAEFHPDPIWNDGILSS